MHLYSSLQQLQLVWKHSMDAVLNSTSQEEEEGEFRRVNETIWAHMSTLPAIFEMLTTKLFNLTMETVRNMSHSMEYRLLEERLLSINEQASIICDWCFTDSSTNQTLTQIVQENILKYIETTLYEEITNLRDHFSEVYDEYTNGCILPEPDIVCTCPNYTETTTEMTTTTAEVYNGTWNSRIHFNWTTILSDIEDLVSNSSNLVSTIQRNLTDPLITTSAYVIELLQLMSPKCSGELEKLYNEYADTQERVLNVIGSFKNELLSRNRTYEPHAQI